MDNLSIKLKTELEYLHSKIGGKNQRIPTQSDLEGITQPNAIKALQFMAPYRAIYEKLEIEGLPINDHEAFRCALNQFNLKTVDDVEQFFDSGDIIEIYDMNLVQMYHNLTFYLYCSYDILQLATTPLYQLYTRDAESNAAIVKKIDEVLKDPNRRTVKFTVPEHYLKETKIKTPARFKINFKYISPLLNEQGEAVAVVTTNHCTPTELHAL